MPDSPVPKSSQVKLAELLDRVRQMPRGGDLEGLLVKEAEELVRIVQQEALSVREESGASDEASFSPSGEPSQ